MANPAKSGVPSAATNGKHGHSLISDEKFRQLYGLVLEVRARVEQANGNGRGLSGREAALAAVAADLRAGDVLLAEPSGLVREAVKGCGAAVFAGEKAFEEGVAECLSRAAADRLRKKPSVAVIFASGRATETMHEARAMASGAKLPVLFVDAAAEDGKAGKNEPDGNALPAIPVDAQDVVALYRVAHESLARARSGAGPTRILCVSWPLKSQEDAVEHLEKWLEARGLPAHAWRQEMQPGLRSL